MYDETIVAVYDTVAHAELAIADLKLAGVPEAAISRHAAMASDTGTEAPQGQGFWSRLFGGDPDHDTAVYDRSLQAGSTVVTVRAAEQHMDQVMEILDSHHPIDIDERAAGYGLTQTETVSTAPYIAPAPAYAPMAATTAATTDDETIRLTEERLTVGKRVVNRGGTRIRRFVVETPVEEQVSLREERVTLERRPVTDGRVVTDADFSEKTIEMTETSEEAVVAKNAYVTEEIRLHKETTDKVQTIRDTVRREDVDIEQIAGGTTTGYATPVLPHDVDA